MPAKMILKLRRGTAAEWTAANPILADGEEGHERDTGKRKVGDGVTAWVDLPYFAGGGAGGDFVPLSGASTKTGALILPDGVEPSLVDFQLIAPPAAPTVAVGAAGNLTGAYTYKVTFRTSSGLETSVGATSAVVNPSGQRVELTGIPVSASPRISSRRIYRTKAGQTPAARSGVGPAYFLVATINDNTTTTYSDNATDASLGTIEAGIRSNTTGGNLWLTGFADPTQPGIEEFLAGHIGWSTTAYGRSAIDTIRAGTYIGMDNTAFGAGALNEVTHGSFNIGVGPSALQRVHGGSQNVAIGHCADQLTEGNYNLAIGTSSLGAATTPSYCVGVGAQALYSVTTGSYNIGIGFNAGVGPAEDPSNALVTGFWNTFIGAESGPGTVGAKSLNRQVAIGYRSKTGAGSALALGAHANAGATGSVAIGTDSTNAGASTTVQDEIKLGTALHTVNLGGDMPLKFNSASAAQTTVGAAGGASALPATPTKYFKVKDSAGTTLVIPAYAAA